MNTHAFINMNLLMLKRNVIKEIVSELLLSESTAKSSPLKERRTDVPTEAGIWWSKRTLWP